MASHRASIKGEEMCLDNETTYHKRILAFKAAVREGPYYICNVCNRCLYKKTVKSFKAIKYGIEFTDLFTMIPSFDTHYYICITCDKHLLKKQRPC